MAGLFFTFSAFAMRALAALPPHQGMAAMQSINTTILNPLFFSVFFGAMATSLYALIYALRHRQEAGAGYLMAGALCYLIGSFLVTTPFNVPLNDALAGVKPGSSEGARVWADYLTRWTLWNHVRTATSTLATAFFALAMQA